MIKVLMITSEGQEVLLNGEFATEKLAKDYIKTAKKIDKKYGSKAKYKVIK